MSGSDVLTRTWCDGDDIRLYRTQDVEDIIEHNKNLQNMPQDRKANWRHIATIPNIFIEQWLFEEYARGNLALKWSDQEFEQIIARKLQDPDWRWLRTDR
jgi:hypothetical protein